ncbi:hypothetical protein KC19_VG226100 [Ceratodon purpureus]|uniref:Uncharacterized protein n=1 Tax=Ceratodon purpureus TaxID=3225 RepID=A0A8T0HT83_CERPU|nr:hypothetical protein KC19_VG226100 [Ceratodon purpureus]
MVVLPFSFLKYILGSAWLLVIPCDNNQESILEYQALGACFSPYNALFNLHTLLGSPADWNRGGISM